MTYVKTTWIDDFTPVNAKNLNNIENGIEQVEKSIPTKVSQLKNDIGYINDISGKADTSYVDDKNEELSNKINVLSGNKNKILNEGLGNYDTPTKPSDYTSNSITSVALRKCSGTEASEYGYWNNILAIKNHGEDNCFELGFTNNSNVIFRKQDGANDTWLPWQQIATTTKTDILFQGAATTTFTLAKSFSGYDEFKVMGYTASHTHSTYTHNNFDFNTLGNTESGYLVFGVGVVQFQCNGTEFKILSNPNNVIISKIVAIKRGDK